MNIKSMLMRLQDVLGSHHLWQEIVLLPGTSTTIADTKNAEINLVVGYNGSPKSHTALDLALWIAHQTRLTTPKPVTVHVVYVMTDANQFHTASSMSDRPPYDQANLSEPASRSTTATLTKSVPDPMAILQQADHLAKEWAGSLKVHLRIGAIAPELREVVTEHQGALLFLGCSHSDHAIPQQLGAEFSCPVLGIPNQSPN